MIENILTVMGTVLLCSVAVVGIGLCGWACAGILKGILKTMDR